MAKITVTRRPGGLVDRFRKYIVVVDDAQTSAIGPGQRATFDVGPGPHTVEIMLDWTRSPRLTVDAGGDSDAGRDVELFCAPTGNPVTALYYAFLDREHYISLRKV